MKLKYKSSILQFRLGFSWFFMNFLFGYYASKMFWNLFSENKIKKTDPCKNIQVTKKFSFKNIIKIIIKFFWKLLKNWFTHIDVKFLLLIDAINKVGQALQICKEKFTSLLKFKYNFRILKNLLPIFWETFLIACSLLNEILLLNNIRNWVIQWVNLIQLVMNESVLISRILDCLYWILLGIFGIMIGFLVGAYKREDEINEFLLLIILLRIIYNNWFDDVLLEYLYDLSRKPKIVKPFSKFSLKTMEQAPRSLDILFEEPEQIPLPLPFLIIEDPLLIIETEVLWEQPINYQFELFKFYRYINQKVKH